VRYGLTQTIAPAALPLALPDVKEFLRVTDTDQDKRLYGLINAARERFETQTCRCLVTSTWQLVLDQFWDLGMTFVPGGPFATGFVSNTEWRSWQERGGWGLYGLGMIRSPRNPLQAVSAINYVDTSGATQLLASSGYQVDSSREVARIVPAYAQTWPSTRAQLDAVTITFTAGYGPVTSVAAAVATGSQIVTPASMAGIALGMLLVVDPDTVAQESVLVTAVTGTTFTATFALAHQAGAAINNVPPDIRRCLMQCVGVMDENRNARLADLEEMLAGVIAPHESKTYV